MKCLLSSTYTMTAEVLSRQPAVPDSVDGNEAELENIHGEKGWYDMVQDPDSGAFERVWVPYTPELDEDENPLEPTRTWIFECIARGVIDGGIRVAGTTERFTSKGMLETVDYVSIKFPPHVLLTRRDRVTNIRDVRSGRLLWVEEETGGKATVFEVNGVTPVIDPFGNHVQNFALLERAEVQSG